MGDQESRDACLEMVKYRAEKRFRIFTWSSSVLLGAIGAFALVPETTISHARQYAFFFALLILGVFSIFWLITNRRDLASALKELRDLEKTLEINRPEATSEPRHLYEIMVVGLLLFALWSAAASLPG